MSAKVTDWRTRPIHICIRTNTHTHIYTCKHISKSMAPADCESYPKYPHLLASHPRLCAVVRRYPPEDTVSQNLEISWGHKCLACGHKNPQEYDLKNTNITHAMTHKRRVRRQDIKAGKGGHKGNKPRQRGNKWRQRDSKWRDFTQVAQVAQVGPQLKTLASSR